MAGPEQASSSFHRGPQRRVCVMQHAKRSVHLLTFGFLANDVSKSSHGIARVRTTFAGAFTILTSTAFLHAGFMNSRREGRYTNLRARRAPEDLSILSSILGISHEVCPYLSPTMLTAETVHRQ